jgi:hypothetical protein
LLRWSFEPVVGGSVLLDEVEGGGLAQASFSGNHRPGQSAAATELGKHPTCLLSTLPPDLLKAPNLGKQLVVSEIGETGRGTLIAPTFAGPAHWRSTCWQGFRNPKG